MFIKVTKKPNGSSFVRVMESVRHQDKVIQKTLHCVGSSKTQEGIRALEKAAGEILVKLSNDRQPVLPGMEKIIYSKEPEYVKKKSKAKSQRKKKTKPLSLFSLKSPRERERVHYGIKGVCGALYEQLKFHTIIEGTNKDQQLSTGLLL